MKCINILRRFTSVLMIFVFFIVSSSSFAVASETSVARNLDENNQYEREIHEDVIIKNEEYHVDRTYNNGIVHVEVSDEYGDVLWNGSIAIDEIEKESLYPVLGEQVQDSALSKGIKWGSWSTQTTTKNYKPTVAAVLGILIAFCPLAPVKVLSIVAQAMVADSSYKYVTIRRSSRIGTGSKYRYAQHKYTIWIRKTKSGTKKHLYGPTTFTQKKK